MDKAKFVRKAKTPAVSIDIKDSEGGLLKTVLFDPGDARGAKVFAEIIQKTSAIDDVLKDADSDQDSIITVVNILDDIFADLDKIFGAGTTELLTYGVINEESIECLKGFLDVVTPFYQKSAEERERRLKPYAAKAVKNEQASSGSA